MGLPGVPGDLDAIGKKLYRDLRAYMRDAARWEDSDHHLLAQTCRYDMRARAARDALRKAGDMTSEGDRKQLTVHPLVRVAEAAEKAFVEGLKELGFTPRARAALGLESKPPGESKFGL
jgi:P27 family predicted phage terminase small subunit